MTTRGRGSGRSKTWRAPWPVDISGVNPEPQFGQVSGIMIGNRVGFGDLAQGLALVALLPARLAARLLAQAPGAPPLLLPRRRLAQSIAGRRLAAVGAVQAEPALEFVEPCRQRQHQIDQFVFRQEGKGFTIHWILESHHPLLVNQNLGIQSIKPTKSARPSYPAARPSATWAVTILFMFQARVTRFHSPVTLSRPRSENWRKPMADLMMPNTGSGVCLRRA